METGALLAYTVLFLASGLLERPLGMEAAERSSAADVKRLNAFRPPAEWREPVDDDKDATAVSNDAKRRKDKKINEQK